MSNSVYSTLLNCANKTEKLSYANERGLMWQQVLIVSPSDSNTLIKLLEKHSVSKKRLTKLLVSSDSEYWISHETYDWIPVWICPDQNLKKVTVSKSHSYFTKTLNIDEPDSRIVKKYERLLMLSSSGAATGFPTLKLKQKLAEVQNTPLRKVIEKKIIQNFKGTEKEARLTNLSQSRCVLMTDFLSDRKRLRASWKGDKFSKSRILPSGLSIFFSSEDSVRSDSKIPDLLAQAQREQAHVGEYFFPSSLQTLQKKS
jgi:hypothetical protein